MALLALLLLAQSGESWLQHKGDPLRSGNASARALPANLGLAGVVPLTDAVLSSPVVAGGRAYVVDASGMVTAFDTSTFKVVWRAPTEGHNNVASPALAGDFLHVATSGSAYYVFRASDGTLRKKIPCGEPVFASPLAINGRVYFATLGARVHAVEPDGTPRWTWDYLKEEVKFPGDRWSGRSWLEFRNAKTRPSDQFTVSRDIAANGQGHVLVPAGPRLLWIEDLGDRAIARDTFALDGPILALSCGPESPYKDHATTYGQWHSLDNEGRVDRLGIWGSDVYRWTAPVPGTATSATDKDLVSFSSVSVAGDEIYRTRPHDGFGLCRHRDGAEPLSAAAAVAPPIILKDAVIYGDLEGRLHVVPRAKGREPWVFRTPFGKAISAPPAVCDGRVYFGSDDGYLYVLGPEGTSPPPEKDLELWKIRSPLTGPRADVRYDRSTSFGDSGNTNADAQGIQPPFSLGWIRRFDGTTKHFSTFGAGRLYTHTAEGQIFAVEQETGRLLWRRYFPRVHLSYTSPLYDRERLLVPQAGAEGNRLRCLNAATGELLWEAPFEGSPGWNRQAPPVVAGDLAIYSFGTGTYPAGGWLDRRGGFAKDRKPLVRAYALATGRVAWEKDFSEFGSGGDESGLCVMDGTLYYSCSFGRAAGITAALEPSTGRVLWSTREHFIRGSCVPAAKDGRIYVAGTGPDPRTGASHVWCLDARNGELIWRSDPLKSVKIFSVGSRFIFTHVQYGHGSVLDVATGKILVEAVGKGYKCTRFTLSEPYLLGSNLDVLDLSDPAAAKLVWTGPRMDFSECVGATVSNGRIYYTAHGSGLQVSLASVRE